MNKYEISVWKDTFVKDNIDSEDGHWEEERLAVIGSDTMTTQARARQPKLVSNINGTNTFSFLVYYSFIDIETGEKIRNPFVPYLVNERKVKVYWKNKWYDFLIKDIKEDSVNHTFTYTCEDLYVTELSRSGFSLEFDSVLQNNIGTPEELVNAVIENTEWQFDSENSDTIYQITEEAVYEVVALADFDAIQEPEGILTTIEANTKLLVFYSCAPGAKEDALKPHLQFVYAPSGTWETDDNDMLVLNGICCSVEVEWTIDEGIVTASIEETPILTINIAKGVSKNYRAGRYVDSQKTVFNPIVNRYVDVYTQNGKEICGYQTTEFNDANVVVNLITNPSNFTNASGWKKSEDDTDGLLFRIYPPFDKDTIVAEYEAKSYLRVCKHQIYENSGIQNNRSYIKNGFVAGEVYICRYKCRGDNASGGCPSDDYIEVNLNPTIQNYFSTSAPTYDSETNWVEFKLTCNVPCSFDELLTIGTRPVFSLDLSNVAVTCWIEEIQLFKEVFGRKQGEEDPVRINPNEMDIQSIANTVYYFFDPNQTVVVQEADDTHEEIRRPVASIDELEFISGENATPVMNGFQRFGTIEESNSNRFNILQSIAEAFECWVRFRIDHDEKGAITGKYIQLKQEIGQESGLTFVYGIDLQGVTRNLTSSQISTKTIVLSNSNEFGKNGFCTIARSQQNYSRDNVIYNFDYYVQQGLLDKDTIQQGLQNYYDILHTTNIEYTDNLEELTQKKTELTRQNASATVYQQYLSSAEQEKIAIEDDLIKLAGVNNINAALEYAKTHLNNQKVQALVNDRTYVINNIQNYKNLTESIEASIKDLQQTINSLETEQKNLITTLTTANTDFYKKYSRFIQEGTWKSEDYYNDDLYYLDALQVAYESSRPQITYTINVLRVSDTIDFASKEFNLADIAYIQDVEYFGYKDEFTPYKEKVFLSEVTSYFDSPEKDQLKVQNYLTQFDDLFQRITAATQSLEFSEGKYSKAANIVATDGTIKASVIQETFNSNADLVYGAQNEAATIDNTGITVTNNDDGSHLVRVTSGGIFVSNDAGTTWKNAIRGDGISTDLLTAGRINTQEINIYNTDVPAFRWDSVGISAYAQNITTDDEGNVIYGAVDTSKFVRFDQFGMYGLHLIDEETFVPKREEDIYNKADFGLTWKRFFIKSQGDNGSVEISSNQDILVKAIRRDSQGEPIPGQEIDRVRIGRLDEAGNEYGLEVQDNEGRVAFLCNSQMARIAGWEITADGLKSTGEGAENQYISIGSDGSIGCFGKEAATREETAYQGTVLTQFRAVNVANASDTRTFSRNSSLYIFSSTIKAFSVTYERAGLFNSAYSNCPSTLRPTTASKTINIGVVSGGVDLTYQPQINIDDIQWDVTQYDWNYLQRKINVDEDWTEDNTMTTYTYYFKFTASILNNDQTTTAFLSVPYYTGPSPTRSNHAYSQGVQEITSQLMQHYVPKADNAWTIDQYGNAIFHNLFADGGQIAGWYIDGERIYQTWDGTPNLTRTIKGKVESNIKSELNSSGTANRDGIDYSVVTDAINAAMANIGGVLMSGGLINGYNIAKVMSRAKAAGDKADQSYQLAYQAYQLAYQVSQSLKDYVKTSTYSGHRHQVWVYKGEGDVGQWNRSQTPTY